MKKELAKLNTKTLLEIAADFGYVTTDKVIAIASVTQICKDYGL